MSEDEKLLPCPSESLLGISNECTKNCLLRRTPVGVGVVVAVVVAVGGITSNERNNHHDNQTILR